MKIEPGCIPCILNQAYKSAVLFAEDNIVIQEIIMQEVCKSVIDNQYKSAPHFSARTSGK